MRVSPIAFPSARRAVPARRERTTVVATAAARRRPATDGGSRSRSLSACRTRTWARSGVGSRSHL